MPEISIIVPVYKTLPYIHRCVDSILAQSFEDFEIILVDDGCPDNCGAICDEYAKIDHRVHVIHQENQGLSAARNAGIDWAFANSNSKWLSFVDSDDYIHPGMLAVLLDAANRYGLAVSVCAYEETTGDPLKDDNGQISVWNAGEFFLLHNVNATVAWGKLYKKSCFTEIRYPVGKVHEDEYVTYKIIFATGRIAVSTAKLYGYFHNTEGITKASWNPRRMDALDALEEQIKFYKSNGYIDLAKYRLNGYVGNIQNQMKWIRKEPLKSTRRSYMQNCRQRLRRLICGYSSIIQFSLIGHYTVFCDAYPILIPFFWLYRVIRVGIGKVLRNALGNDLADKVRNIVYRKN